MGDRYAVVGNPIGHSKSPFIHAEFAQQTAQEMLYEALEFGIGQFAEEADRFFQQGGMGLNVTAPFKQEAYEFVHQTTLRARRAGAVNTIYRDAEQNLVGDNTDGIGLLTDLRDNLGWTLEGRKVLILGAGGAVRGILGPLLEAKPQLVVIANRTESRARSLVKAFQSDVPLQAVALDTVVAGSPDGSQTFDLVINGTSGSWAEESIDLPPSLIGSGSCCYDLVYGPAAKAFLDWARNAGASATDGLGMLVEQAAESFRIWRGVMPETAPVMKKLREQIDQSV